MWHIYYITMVIETDIFCYINIRYIYGFFEGFRKTIDGFHLTSWRPYLCPKLILWDFSSILIQTFPIVSVLQDGRRSREWKPSIALEIGQSWLSEFPLQPMIIEFLERCHHIWIWFYSGHFSLTVGEERSEDLISVRTDLSLHFLSNSSLK